MAIKYYASRSGVYIGAFDGDGALGSVPADAMEVPFPPADLSDYWTGAAWGKMNIASSKSAIVDADLLPIVDSESGSILKKVTLANVKIAVKNYITTFFQLKPFISGLQTITAGGQLTIAHGLGDVPSNVSCFLRCGTNNQGYAVGDKVIADLTPGFQVGLLNSSPTNQGASVVADATNVVIRFGSDNPTFQIINKGNGNVGNITNSSWKLIVVAWP